MFIYGVGLMIPGFEAGIAGLQAGEKKIITVKAADAYGEYDPNLLVAVPREQFPPGIVLETDLRFLLQTESGPLPARVKATTDKEVLMDCNPPLAGEDLTFDVEILEVRDPTEDERLFLQANS